MARRNTHEECVLNKADLERPVLFVVDMVNGFAKSGPLADVTIANIARPIQQLIDLLQTRTIFVCDSHRPDSKEFASYPAHCLEGSEEAEVIDELLPYKKESISKNSTNTFMAPAFQKILPSLMEEYTDFILTGCCTDLCILQFALSLRSYFNEMDVGAHRIIIPENCIDTYEQAEGHEAAFWNEAAIQNMKQNGIIVVRGIEA